MDIGCWQCVLGKRKQFDGFAANGIDETARRIVLMS